MEAVRALCDLCVNWQFGMGKGRLLLFCMWRCLWRTFRNEFGLVGKWGLFFVDLCCDAFV